MNRFCHCLGGGKQADMHGDDVSPYAIVNPCSLERISVRCKTIPKIVTESGKKKHHRLTDAPIDREDLASSGDQCSRHLRDSNR